MKYSIDFNIEAYCEDLQEDYSVVATYTFSEDLDDVISFLYQEKFGKAYNELDWYLEPGAKEFIKDIEEKWLKNQIDGYEIVKNPNFKKWVIDNRLNNDLIDEALKELKSDVSWDLESLSDEELKELDDSGYITVEYEIPEIHYIGSFDVDLPDYDEDE